MADIVERLRTGNFTERDIKEAADEIEQLRGALKLCVMTGPTILEAATEIERLEYELKAAKMLITGDGDALLALVDENERLRERCAALERAVDYEAGEPGTVEYHKALFDRLHAAEAAIRALKEKAQ